MAICLPKKSIQDFKKALKIKEINMSELLNMKHPELVALFEKYAGSEAQSVATLFEEKLILKNRLKGIENLFSKLGEIGKYSPEGKQALENAKSEFRQKQQQRIFSPAENENFLNGLADKIVGTNINEIEAKNIFNFTTIADNLKKGFDDKTETWSSDQQAKQYGAAKVLLENYFEELKTGKMTLAEMLKERLSQFKETAKTNTPRAVGQLLMDTLKTISDNSISLVATLDNSFMGRQGLKTLMTHPSVWWEDMVKGSFSDIAKTLGGQNAKDALWADIYSRPNYLNGSYDLAKLIPKTEEQFPTLLPERLPIVGRAIKASEVAFTGSAIRGRTKLFDLLSERAKDNGVDMTDKYQIKSLGTIINSLTAKGQFGYKAEGALRLILWAPRMIKANIDVLTGHLGQDISPFARKQAAINLLKIVTTSATIMMIANALKPKSAETDPRSSDFGKIKIGNTRFDFTGGAASLITLASRLITQSTKSATTGVISSLGSKVGQTSMFDVITNFLTGKTTPPVRVLIDFLQGRNFKGEVPTLGGELYQASVPISIQNAIQLKDDNSAEAVLGVILDGLGINANTYVANTNWEQNLGKELQQFKDKVGDAKFKEANDLYNKQVSDWFIAVKLNSKFSTLSDEDKQKVIVNKKLDIKNKIFRRYGFIYRQTKSKPVPKF